MFVQEKIILSAPEIGDIEGLVFLWRYFIKQLKWEDVIKNVIPRESGCGLVYEIEATRGLPAGDFAIVDMRNIHVSEPHYHCNGEIEIYFVLAGTALIVVSGIEYQVKTGDVIIIEPNKAHFTIPDKNFVIAAVNIPSFNPENYILLDQTNHSVGFDLEEFNKIILQNT